MQFIKGMDVSMLNELERLNAAYYENGVKKDIFDIFQDYKINAVRLRLWVNPYDENGNAYGGGTNDLETTVKMAKRIKKHGMKFLLDIHYSDFWADPKNQIKPKAWRLLSYEELVKKVHDYTCDVMKEFKQKDLLPWSVQIGNEITNGMLLPDGSTSDFSRLSELIKSGICAVKETAGDKIRIILHLDYGGNNEQYRRWFDGLLKYDVDFDIIGLSYYPYWHGTFDELLYNLNDISERYDKDVLVVETSYAFSTDNCGNSGTIFTKELAKNLPYSATSEGQAAYIKKLMTIINSVKNKRGLGFFYWEPEWIAVDGTSWATKEGEKYLGDKSPLGNPWVNQTLFDFKGNTQQAFRTIRDFI